MATNRFSIETVFKAVDKMTAPITRMQNRMGRFSRSFTRGLKTMNRGVDSFTRGLKRSAIAMTAVVFAAGAAQADILRLGADFERTMVDTGLRFTDRLFRGDKGFELLQKQARDLGRSTVVTATEVAQAQNLLVRSGFQLEEVLALTEPTIAFAVVSQLSLAEATTIATESLNIMGLRTGDATNVLKNYVDITDQMTFMSNRANITVSNLFDSLKKAGPVAVAASQSLGDLLTVLTVLGRKGIKEGEAGTAFRNIIASIQNVTPEAEKILGFFTLSSVDAATGEIRSMIDVFEDLNRVTTEMIEAGQLTKAEQVVAFFKVFGRRPFAAAAGLTSSAAGEIQALQELGLSATGTVKLMSDELLNTTFGAIKEFQSALEGVKLTMFETEKGPMTDFIRRMTEIVRAFEREGGAQKIGEFAVKLIDNFDEIVAVLKQIGKATVFILGLIAALKILTVVMALVNVVMLANPVGLLTFAIGALIISILAVIFWWDELNNTLRGVPLWLKIAAVTFLWFASGPVGALVAAAIFIVNDWEKVKLLFTDINFLLDAFGDKLLKLEQAGFIKDFGDFLVTDKFLGGVSLAGLLGITAVDSSTSAVVTPEERAAKLEKERKDSLELFIRSDMGTVEVVGGTLGPRLKLRPTGVF